MTRSVRRKVTPPTAVEIAGFSNGNRRWRIVGRPNGLNATFALDGTTPAPWPLVDTIIIGTDIDAPDGSRLWRSQFLFTLSAPTKVEPRISAGSVVLPEFPIISKLLPQPMPAMRAKVSITGTSLFDSTATPIAVALRTTSQDTAPPEIGWSGSLRSMFFPSEIPALETGRDLATGGASITVDTRHLPFRIAGYELVGRAGDASVIAVRFTLADARYPSNASEQANLARRVIGLGFARRVIADRGNAAGKRILTERFKNASGPRLRLYDEGVLGWGPNPLNDPVWTVVQIPRLVGDVPLGNAITGGRAQLALVGTQIDLGANDDSNEGAWNRLVANQLTKLDKRPSVFPSFDTDMRQLRWMALLAPDGSSITNLQPVGRIDPQPGAQAFDIPPVSVTLSRLRNYSGQPIRMQWTLASTVRPLPAPDSQRFPNEPPNFGTSLSPWLSATGPQLVGALSSIIAGSSVLMRNESADIAFAVRVATRRADMDATPLRVGSLDLIPGEHAPPASDPQRPGDAPSDKPALTGSPTAMRVTFATPAGAAATTPDITSANLSVELAIAEVRPGAQDDSSPIVAAEVHPPGKTENELKRIWSRYVRESPMVVPWRVRSMTNLVWRIEETVGPTAIAGSLQARAESQVSTTDANARSAVVVVDRAPFLVAVTEFPPALEQGTGAGASVADWKSLDGRPNAWYAAVRANSELKLWLPPQATGEAAEKYHTIAEDAKADYRFGPMLEADVQRDAATSTAVMPWNLRRLLGDVDDPVTADASRRDPLTVGLKVRHLQYELLYGLSCNLDTGVRLADVASRYGQIPGWLKLDPFLYGSGDASPQPIDDQAGKWFALQEAWSEVFARYRSRLAVLEPWDPDAIVNTPISGGEDKPETSARRLLFKKDLQCRLRPADVLSPIDAKPFSRDGALPGGALWGLEAAHVYDVLLEQPKSTSAAIADPGFSALGAWGFQVARFNNDLSAIYANVAMGRTYHYVVERIGRLNCFWLPMKHVIVYERTVLPSSQFGPSQSQLLGRPVLRKVREYVEFLHPSRRYPEESAALRNPPVNDAAAAAAAGVVSACEVPPHYQIPVQSSWGSDVGSGTTAGWKVPLWLSNLSEDDPIYPKPREITIKLRSEEGGKPIEITATLDNPQDFCFYTLTTVDAASDPTQWMPAAGIDFASQPVARPGARDSTPAHPTTPPAGVSDPAVLPGFQAVTIRLANLARPVNILAGRRDAAGQPLTPLFASLDSVTLGRCPPVFDGSPDAASAAEASLAAELQKAEQQMPQLGTELRAELRRIAATAGEGVLGKSIPDPGAAVRAWATARETSLKNDAANLLAQRRSVAAEYLSKLDASVANVGAASDRALDHLFVAAIDANDNLSRYAAIWRDLPIHVEQWLQTGADIGSEKAARAALGAMFDQYVRGALAVAGATAEPANVIAQANVRALAGLKQAVTDANGLSARIAAVKAAIQAVDSACTGPDCLGAVRGSIEQLRADAERAFAAAIATLRAHQQTAYPEVGTLVEPLIVNARAAIGAIDSAARIANSLGASAVPNAKTLLSQVDGALNAIATASIQVAESKLDSLLAERWNSDVVEKLKGTISPDTIRTLVADTSKKFVDSNEIKRLRGEVVNAEKTARDTLWTSSSVLRSRLNDAGQDVDKRLAALRSAPALLALEQTAKQGSAFVGTMKDLAATRTADFNAAVDAALHNADGLVDDLSRQAREQLASRLELPVNAAASTALHVVRAFGAPPEIPGLDFVRPAIAYRFPQELTQLANVEITPVVAHALASADAAKALLNDPVRALGLRVPTAMLGKLANAAAQEFCGVVPDELKNFGIGDVIPDLSGIRLGGLLSNIPFPAGAKDNVRITHGTNEDQRSAWIQAELQDTTLVASTPLCTLGPVTLRLVNARLMGTSRVEGRAGQGVDVSRRSKAVVSGAIALDVGGQPVVEFSNVALTFTDPGGLKMQFGKGIQDIKFNGALQSISDALPVTGPDDGLSLRLLPNGVECRYGFTFPSIGGPTTAIRNANFALRFALTLEPGDGVTLTAGVSLSRKEMPFTITAFILGGSGYVDVALKYLPFSGVSRCSVEIGASASASLSIALGPIEGAVGVYMGLEFEGEWGQGHRPLSVGYTLLIEGHVSILGIVDAGISLLLELLYNGQALTGRGTFSCHIKICWCFTLRVRKSVEYTLQCTRLQAAQQEQHEMALLDVADSQAMPSTTLLPPADIAQLVRAARTYLSMLA